MYLKLVPLSSFGPVQKYWSRLSARASGTELAAEIKLRIVQAN